MKNGTKVRPIQFTVDDELDSVDLDALLKVSDEETRIEAENILRKVPASAVLGSVNAPDTNGSS